MGVQGPKSLSHLLLSQTIIRELDQNGTVWTQMVPTWDASTRERGLGYYTMMLARNLCFLKHILKIHLQKVCFAQMESK